VRYLDAEYRNDAPSYTTPSVSAYGGGAYGGSYASSLADDAGASASTRIVPLRQTAAR